jgi:polysaccharide export outer membrane protein
MLSGLLIILVTGCSSSGNRLDTPPEVQPTLVYTIGLADSLQIDVWRRSELSVEVTVRPDGMISMPLIGDIVARGKTVGELASDITTELNDYIKSPQVTVIVVNPVSASYQRRVRVTGAVNNQLSVPFRDGMTVLDLVLEAGGPTVFAAANKASLFRKDASGVTAAYSILLNDILLKGKLETNYALQPSDVITVPEKVF